MGVLAVLGWELGLLPPGLVWNKARPSLISLGAL